MHGTTLSGAIDTDPYFDPRSLRADYYDKHEIPVDVQSRPIDGIDLVLDYRAFVSYSNAEDVNFDVLRVELLVARTEQERVQGRPQRSRPPHGIELSLVPIMAWDAERGEGRKQVLDRIDQHQTERDEDRED